jgi:hypothetical protein
MPNRSKVTWVGPRRAQTAPWGTVTSPQGTANRLMPEAAGSGLVEAPAKAKQQSGATCALCRMVRKHWCTPQASSTPGVAGARGLPRTLQQAGGTFLPPFTRMAVRLGGTSRHATPWAARAASTSSTAHTVTPRAPTSRQGTWVLSRARYLLWSVQQCERSDPARGSTCCVLSGNLQVGCVVHLL